MKNVKILIGFCLLSLIPLSACSSSDDEETLSLVSPAAGGPLLPLPGNFSNTLSENDPGNGMFMDSVTAWLKDSGAPANSQYEFTRIDLNGDGMREGLVLLESPHQEWCMDYGCTMLIFEASEKGFNYRSEISPIRGPMVITNAQTNGWRDIMAYISGRDGQTAKNVELKYNGAAYPVQPAMLPAVALNMEDIDGIGGTKIFP